MSVLVRGTGETVSLEEARLLVNSGQAKVARATNPQLTAVAPGDITSRGWRDDHVAGGFTSVFMPDGTTGWDHMLSRPRLRQVYLRSAAVRPCVDFIVRSLSTCPWRIVAEPGVPKRDFNRAVELFTRPAPGYSFRSVRAQYLNDLMVMDGAVLEKVFSRGNDLVEFVPRDFARFSVKWDFNGIINKFVQVVRLDDKTEKKVEFTPDQISYSVLYPRTSSPYGTPTIVTITQEIAALLLASQDIAAFFDSNEIPQGILSLGEIGEEGFNRAKEEFQAAKGGKTSRTLYVTHGAGDTKWVPFRRPYREQEIAQLMPRLERIVFRNYGVTPLDLGMSADVNRSTAEAYKELRAFTLFKPIMDLMAEKFTYDILHEIHPGLFLELAHVAQIGDESVTIDSDIPGEGEGASWDASSGPPRGYRVSPFFGDGLSRRGRRLVSRPDGMGMVRGTRASKFIRYSQKSDEELLTRFGGTKETAALVHEVHRIKTVIQIFVDEANQRLTELESCDWEQAREILGRCQDQVVGVVDDAILAAEAASLQHVLDVDPALGYLTVTDGLSRTFARVFNRVFVVPTFDDFADQPSDAVDPFPKLFVLECLKQAAAAPIRASLRAAERNFVAA